MSFSRGQNNTSSVSHYPLVIDADNILDNNLYNSIYFLLFVNITRLLSATSLGPEVWPDAAELLPLHHMEHHNNRLTVWRAVI